MLREHCSSICNLGSVVIYIWSRYFNPSVAYEIHSDLLHLLFGQKNSFGKIIYINPFIYSIFKISFASYVPGHNTLNLKICCPLITRVEGLYLVIGENTWPTKLIPLTSFCHFPPQHPQQSAFDIPAKAEHLAMHPGFGTCLLLYFKISAAKLHPRSILSLSSWTFMGPGPGITLRY